MSRRAIILTVACALGAGDMAPGGARAESDFASEVVEYRPAPGQFVNGPGPLGEVFNDPAAALGAPIGGGTSAPDNSKLLSLGGFGGSVTLRFASTVADDPCNPFGLDAIVFGNAFWNSGNPASVRAEPGVIEISRDTNANGLADDAWFLIPGSLIPNNPPATVPDDAFVIASWDDDPNSAAPPADASWYPDPAVYAFVPPGFPSTYETWGWLVPTGAVGVGAADTTPVLLLGDLDADDVVEDPGASPEAFYTRPDNPWATGITPGSAGGDAFDIAWAVDPATGAPANLDGFDFIRVSTGEDAVQFPLGERSTEVGAVADVRPDPAHFDLDGSGGVDVEDLYAWHETPADVSGEGAADALDRWMVERCVRANEGADTLGGRE